jgi:hypothetical protein
LDNELYLKKLDEKINARDNLRKIEYALNTLVHEENKNIGNQIKQQAIRVFGAKELELSKYEEKWDFTGRYHEDSKMICYSYKITKYLTRMYKGEYKNKINRRFKHEISINYDYDIMEQKFKNVYLYSDGFHYGGLIKDKALKESTRDLMINAKSLIDCNNVVLKDMESRLKEIKELFDNYDAYLIATILTI